MATTNTSPVSQIQWPRPDFTKTPADVYVDPKIFAAEQERIFRGPTWQILGTEAEVPNAGDFQTTYIGTTPIVLHRAHDNSLNAYVNRCAHRGSRVIRELRGNQAYPVCPYHNWRYDGTGKLLGVALQDGLKGKGGYPADFSKAANGLKRLRVASISGVVFGTFSDAAPELTEYFGTTNWRTHFTNLRPAAQHPRLSAPDRAVQLEAVCGKTIATATTGHNCTPSYPSSGSRDLPTKSRLRSTTPTRC